VKKEQEREGKIKTHRIVTEPPVIFGFKFGTTKEEIEQEYETQGGHEWEEFSRKFMEKYYRKEPKRLLEQLEYNTPLVPVENAGKTILLFYQNKLAKITVRFDSDVPTSSLFGPGKKKMEECSEVWGELEDRYEKLKQKLVNIYNKPDSDSYISEMDWDAFREAGSPWERYSEYELINTVFGVINIT